MKLLAGQFQSTRWPKTWVPRYIKLPLVTRPVVRRFSDMEVFVEINENVRGEDVFVIQSTSFPANDNLMELLIVIDALRRASARRVTAVIPYFGYARQDRKPSGRARRSPPSWSPTSCPHARGRRPRAHGRPSCRPDPGLLRYPHRQPLRHAGVWCAIIQDYIGHDNLMIVSPDVGGVVRARALAKRLGADLAIVDKRRERAEADPRSLRHEHHRRTSRRHASCILIDDIVDSGGTICNAAEALLREGAKDVCAYATHGVLSGSAVARIKGSKLKSLVILENSIASTDEVAKCANIRRISIALIGEAMRRINNEESVSSLFD